MASLSFSYTPDFTAVQNSKPTTRVVKFSDGYEQRIAFGLNTDLKTWRLRFKNRSNDETTQIKGFFEARRGVDSFTWTDPYGGISFYVCEDWSVEHAACNINNIEATFRQVVALQ